MSDFDLAQEFQESKVHKYTLKNLQSDLHDVYVPSKQKKKKTPGQCKGNIPIHDMESYFNEIRSHCAEIFPSCRDLNFAKLEPWEKFQYLKFFYYMGKSHSEWQKNNYRLFHCLQAPSQRHRQYYIKMLEEIIENKDKLSLHSQVAEEIWGRDGQGYADSFHTVQDQINLIASSLHNIYKDAPEWLLAAIEIFNKTLDEYAEKSAQIDMGFDFKLSCWDELCLLLAYNRDLYWENDLLEAHRISAANATSYSHIPDGKKFIDYGLIYRNGKIVELPLWGKSGELFLRERTEISSKEYLDALEIYVNEHINEITAAIFPQERPDRNRKERVINRFSNVRAFWELEWNRYGRNSSLTRCKLIATYQVIFMSQPKSGVNLFKPGTPKRREGDNLYRESKSLSSTYKDPSQKEPLYQQLICILTDNQMFQSVLPPDYRNCYSEINIKALEAITAVDWRSRPAAVQARAESILLLTAEALIPVEDDAEEIPDLEQRMNEYMKTDSTDSAQLHRLGAYCRLFNAEVIAELIKKEKETLIHEGPFSVSVNEGSENAVLFHNLTLEIDYIPDQKCYSLKSFPSHSVEDLLNEERKLCQRNENDAAGS